MNEGSTEKWYTTACSEECAGYTYQCTNNQFNNGKSCTKTSDGGSVWYKTACESISCSEYGSNSWYGSAVNCKNYCNSIGAYYSYVGLANDGVTRCYQNSEQNDGEAGPCLYCATVYNPST